MSRSSTLYISNLPYDITERQLEEVFGVYGAIHDINIPRDKITARHRNYAFVLYTKKDNAKEALRALNGSKFFGNQIGVSFAQERSQRNPRRVSRSPSRRSRSRSPISSEAELRQKLESLLNMNRDLQAKHSTLLSDLEDINRRSQKQKDENVNLERQLISHQTGAVPFLPCGHRKTLKMQDIILIDELYEIGFSKLTDAERTDERLTRKLRSLIFYKVASKLPDVYRCTVEEKWVLGDCGHIATAKCWEVRESEKGSQKLKCSHPVEKLLPCGHSYKTECSSSNAHLVCRQC
jgi:RNA recognition motif-containing protein